MMTFKQLLAKSTDIKTQAGFTTAEGIKVKMTVDGGTSLKPADAAEHIESVMSVAYTASDPDAPKGASWKVGIKAKAAGAVLAAGLREAAGVEAEAEEETPTPRRRRTAPSENGHSDAQPVGN